MSENEKMNIDQKVAAFALINLAAEAVKKTMSYLEPILNPILVICQILVAVGTAIWIYQRIKGVKLDNKRKQQELDEK